MSAAPASGGGEEPPPALGPALERRRRWMEERELALSGHATSDPRLAELLLRLKQEAGVGLSPPRARAEPPSREDGVVRSLRQELTCPLCLDTLADPQVLDCGHAFCGSCLHAMGVFSPGSSRRCPLCRARVRSPRPSLALRNMAERARGLEEAPAPLVPPAPPPGVVADAPASLETLRKRISIVEAAIRGCDSQLEGFAELAEHYYQSVDKIEARISALRRQRDAMDVEYQAARSSIGAVFKRLDLLRELLLSLRGEKLALEGASAGQGARGPRAGAAPGPVGPRPGRCPPGV